MLLTLAGQRSPTRAASLLSKAGCGSARRCGVSDGEPWSLVWPLPQPRVQYCPQAYLEQRGSGGEGEPALRRCCEESRGAPEGRAGTVAGVLFQPEGHKPFSHLTRAAVPQPAETEEKGSAIPGLRPPAVGGSQGPFSPDFDKRGRILGCTSPTTVGSA